MKELENLNRLNTNSLVCGPEELTKSTDSFTKWPTTSFLFTHLKDITAKMKIQIEIEDDEKANAFINFIKLIDFIEIISIDGKPLKKREE